MKQFVLSKKKWIVTILTFILLSCAFIGVFLPNRTQRAKAESEKSVYLYIRPSPNYPHDPYKLVLGANFDTIYEWDTIELYVNGSCTETKKADKYGDTEFNISILDLVGCKLNAKYTRVNNNTGEMLFVVETEEVTWRDLYANCVTSGWDSDAGTVIKELNLKGYDSGFYSQAPDNEYIQTLSGRVVAVDNVIYDIRECYSISLKDLEGNSIFSITDKGAVSEESKKYLGNIDFWYGYVKFNFIKEYELENNTKLFVQTSYYGISDEKPLFVSSDVLEIAPISDSDLYFGTGSRVSSAGLDTVSNWLYLSADYVNNEYVEGQSIDVDFADVEAAANCSLETQTFTLDQMAYDEVKGVYYMRIDVKTSAIGLPVKLQATLNYSVAGALTTYTVESSERSTVQVLKALKEQGEFDDADKIAEGGYSADYIATVNKLLDSYASGFGTSVENADYINIGTTFKANNENMVYRFDIVGQDEEWVKFFRTVNGAKTDVIKFNFTNGIITVDNAIESRLAEIPFEYWFGPTDVYFRFGFLDELQALETDGWYVVGSGYVNSVASIMHQSEKEALLAEIETLKAAKEAQVELARQKELEAEAAKAELAEAQSAAQAEINALKATILERESEIAELNAQIAANNITIAELNAQIVDLNNQITAKEKEIADLEAAGNASAQNIAKLVADLEALKLEKKKLQEEFDAFKLSADGDNTELLQLIADKNKEITKLKGEKTELEEQNKKLQADNDAAQNANGCAGQLNAGTAYTLILTLSVALIFMGVRYARKRKTDE